MFKDKFKAFITKWNNKWIDYDGMYFNQCKDFTNQYTKEIFGFESPKGNAYPVYFENWNGWTKYRNTPDFLPKPGDICIWNIGSYGHIGVVVKATLDNLIIIDQNTGNGTGKKNNINNRIRIHKYNYNNVYGFIRHNSLINTFVTKPIKEEVKPLISKPSSVTINLKDLYGGKYGDLELPSEIGGIPIKYRPKTKRTLGLARVKGLHYSFKRNEIYIYENYFIKHGTNINALVKILEHEFGHFVFHLGLDEEQKKFLKMIFELKDKKYFVSKYSKTHYAEEWSEMVGFYKAYIEKGIKLPKNKKWTPEMDNYYKLLIEPMYKAGLKDLNKLLK